MGEGEEDDDAKAREAILARRRFFIASAMAGVAASGCGDQTQPQPCLSIEPVEPTESADPAESAMPTKPDPAPTATVTVDDDEGAPRPCLSIVAPPTASAPATATPPAPTTRPRVCLRMAPPPRDDDDPLK